MACYVLEVAPPDSMLMNKVRRIAAVALPSPRPLKQLTPQHMTSEPDRRAPGALTSHLIYLIAQ